MAKDTTKSFELVGHSHQIADTGDYDGCYEITNGVISLFTKDDDELGQIHDEGLQKVVDALNNTGAEFFLDDDKEFELHLAKQEITELKDKVKELEWILEGLRK